jgi:hypothetical protein
MVGLLLASRSTVQFAGVVVMWVCFAAFLFWVDAVSKPR